MVIVIRVESVLIVEIGVHEDKEGTRVFEPLARAAHFSLSKSNNKAKFDSLWRLFYQIFQGKRMTIPNQA